MINHPPVPSAHAFTSSYIYLYTTDTSHNVNCTCSQCFLQNIHIYRIWGKFWIPTAQNKKKKKKKKGKKEKKKERRSSFTCKWCISFSLPQASLPRPVLPRRKPAFSSSFPSPNHFWESWGTSAALPGSQISNNKSLSDTYERFQALYIKHHKSTQSHLHYTAKR